MEVRGPGVGHVLAGYAAPEPAGAPQQLDDEGLSALISFLDFALAAAERRYIKPDATSTAQSNKILSMHKTALCAISWFNKYWYI